MRFRLAVLLLLLAAKGTAQDNKDLVGIDQLQQMIKNEKEKIQVLNFWATWCAPCVKEMPLIEKLQAESPEIIVRLVSMDMDLDPNPDKVRNFVKRKKIASQVLILNERNPNQWIEKIDKSWSGALPATLVVNNKTGKRRFLEGELHDGDLERLIKEVNQ